MEYSFTGTFEDRPSQVIVQRGCLAASPSIKRSDDSIQITTTHLSLFYKFHSKEGDMFDANNLCIEFNAGPPLYNKLKWNFGDEKWRTTNLKGTSRTLDKSRGTATLQDGLLSRAGYTVYDDSSTLVFADNWLEPRTKIESSSAESSPSSCDVYFFGYGTDYLQGLREWCAIAGHVPLVPKFVLGNWWSKYWPYSEESLMQLVQDFESHQTHNGVQLPLSAISIDMDWHIVEEMNHHTWTGYTWNKTLFPDPQRLLNWLHSKGLKVCLNLHPAGGCRDHEDAFKEFAKFMNTTDNVIPFNLADKRFVEGYFKYLHHPHEKLGVDFWWIDWQHGSTIDSFPGLDPLWFLNHLHFEDSKREGKRGVILSRYAGLGSHRYQIGFSGDTAASWTTLQLLPYFTATASNVCFPWWSHDVGGFWHGKNDPELFVRWLQFAVFSPILRLHSMKDEFEERRPWKYDRGVLALCREAFQLRVKLLPYIYSIGWQTHTVCIPLMAPMYYYHPTIEEAYMTPNQYYFGTELLVSPYLTPSDKHTRLSRTVIWIPPTAQWFHFWSGAPVRSGFQALYGAVDAVPVYAKAGAICPLYSQDSADSLELHIFPGTSNSFELYEDDGETELYKKSHYAITTFTKNSSTTEDQPNGVVEEFSIEKVKGDLSCCPKKRSYTLYFKGINQPTDVSISIDGTEVTANVSYKHSQRMLSITNIILTPDNSLNIKLKTTKLDTVQLLEQQKEEEFKNRLRSFDMLTDLKEWFNDRRPKKLHSANDIAGFAVSATQSQMNAMLEALLDCGVHHCLVNGTHYITVWNESLTEDAQFAIKTDKLQPEQLSPVPRGKVFAFEDKELEFLQLEYCCGTALHLVLDLKLPEVKKQPQQPHRRSFSLFGLFKRK